MSATDDPGSGLGLPVRARVLLDAFVGLSADLDLSSVLDRIVASACALTDARYAALVVIGVNGEFSNLVTCGVSPGVREQIGDLPRGRGLLREMIDHPEPLRLKDLRQHPSSVGFPPHHPPMASFLGVPVRIRNTLFGYLYLTEKADSEEFTEEDELLARALVTAAGFVIENAQAFALSEHRRQWLEASVRIGAALEPPIRLATALHQIAIVARTVTNADAVAVLQRKNSDRYDVIASDGPDVDRLGPLVDRFQDTILRCDLEPEEAIVAQGTDPSVVLVPLRAHLAASGVMLVLFPPARGVLEPEEQQLMMSFADVASLALDRAEAIADREELAVVSDRDRIARDLHDVVIQQLFATGLQLQRARGRATDTDVASRIDQAVKDLDGTIRDIRTTIFELRARTQRSLRADVRELVKEYVPVLGYTPALRTVGSLDNLVSEALGAHLLAVLREAISNVARHALATRAAIDIQVSEVDVLLRVVDNGTGFAGERAESGLRNVRRRAHELGGTVRFGNTEPHGTTMEWRVPLQGR